MFFKRYDYTWRCDCNECWESGASFREARQQASEHLVSKHPDNTGVQVFIDQYDLRAGELSGAYWIMERVRNTLDKVSIVKKV